MLNSPQPPLNTKRNPPEPSKKITWKRRFAVLSRWLHIYLSMLSFAIVFFFAVSGLTLNHAAKFGDQVHTLQYKGKLVPEWVNKTDTALLDKNAIARYLRETHHLKGALSDFRIDDSECDLSFKGPGYAADAFISRQTGAYDLTVTSGGIVGVLNDLHKGRDTGSVWAVVIDISAILMTLVSLTGMILLLFLKKKRLSGVILAAMGLLLVYLIYVIWVK